MVTAARLGELRWPRSGFVVTSDGYDGAPGGRSDHNPAGTAASTERNTRPAPAQGTRHRDPGGGTAAHQPVGIAGMLYGVTMWIGDRWDSRGPSMAPWAAMMRWQASRMS